MKAYDFEYAGRTLSSFGCILCSFGEKGIETVSDGCEVAFNTVPTLNGSKHNLTSVQYEDCLESTLQLCKHSCNGGIQEITEPEHRELIRWLSRNKFLKFKILDEDHIDLYYEAHFDINKIEMNGAIYGLELTVKTNRPFALKEPRTIVINNTIQNGRHSINDTSYEEGYIYPHMEIAIKQDGDLKIHNAIENRTTYIADCRVGEIVTLDYPVIQSSDSSHNIQNDFNWTFFRIANTYDNSRNDLTISLPCSIKIRYSPIVKVGI